MALVFSGISAYTKQQIAPLLTEAVFSAKTQELIKSGGILLPKVKSAVAVPKLVTNANFQADYQMDHRYCGKPPCLVGAGQQMPQARLYAGK